MSNLKPQSQEFIQSYCSNPNLAVYCGMAFRPGLHAWMVELEYARFKPDTDANDGFHLFVSKFPPDNPVPSMTIFIVAIDRSEQEFADSILWKHGLKKMPAGMTFVEIGPKGTQSFFLRGPNIFCLENHSKGAKNVLYSNDPAKMDKAREHEKKQAEKFYAEHEAWLKTPEGKAISGAYWKKHPKGEVI